MGGSGLVDSMSLLLDNFKVTDLYHLLHRKAVNSFASRSGV